MAIAGISTHLRVPVKPSGHGLVGAELLLPMRERRCDTYHRRRREGDEGERDRGGGGGWPRWVEGRRRRWRWEDQAELQVFQGDGAIGTRTEGRREGTTGAVFFVILLDCDSDSVGMY